MGSRSAASKASIPAKASTLAKSLAASKQTSKGPIAISESAKGSSKEGAEVASLDIQPLQTVAAVVIGGVTSKRAWTSELVSEGRAAKRD